MFRRLVFEDSAVICTAIAFVTAATIFAFTTWRALRMSRRQADQFAQLPFNSDPASPHDHTA
jgi:hypothetical protein